MIYVLNVTSAGVNRPPAYSGNIIGVYHDLGDALKAFALANGDGKNIHIIPEGADTYYEVWASLDGLADAELYPHIDQSQSMMVEALGYEAATAAGILTNAPTVAPEPDPE